MSKYEYDFEKGVKAYKAIHNGGEADFIPVTTQMMNKKQETSIKKEAAKAVTKTTKATESDIPTKKIWSNSEIGKMDRRTFEKFEAEIDDASREGRIQP